MNNPEYFEKMGYARIDGFLDEVATSIVSQYMENKIHRGEWTCEVEPGDITIYTYYADPLVEVLLLKCKSAVEQAVGKELLPTYSYSTVYRPGEELKIHTDRPACEISVSVNVASKGNVSFFYTKYKENNAQQHTLNPGDAIIYKGCEVEHWRKPLEKDQLNVQFMLHYVDKNGIYQELEKDMRTTIGAAYRDKRIR